MGSTRDNLKRRVRKTVKWGGAGLTVLLLVVWIGSGWFYVTCGLQSRDELGLAYGGNSYSPAMGITHVVDNGWRYGPLRSPEIFWEINWSAVWPDPYFSVPLWPAVLLSLLATAAAWRADLKYLRRVREGACAGCGYDRAGLAAGAVCPECGAAPTA